MPGMAALSYQTIVVHHWSPAYPAEDRADDLAQGCTVPLHTVIAYNFECSVPYRVAVTEGQHGFDVSAVPDQCGICERRYSATDRKRMISLAIAAHLRVTASLASEAEIAAQTNPPIDLVLDV